MQTSALLIASALAGTSALTCHSGTGVGAFTAPSITCSPSSDSCYRTDEAPGNSDRWEVDCVTGNAAGRFHMLGGSRYTACVGDDCNSRHGLSDANGNWLNPIHEQTVEAMDQQFGTTIRYAGGAASTFWSYITFEAKSEPTSSLTVAQLDTDLGILLANRGYTFPPGITSSSQANGGQGTTVVTYIMQLAMPTPATQTRFTGQTLPESHAAPTHADCEQACLNHPVCAGYTYYPSTWCSLYMTITGTQQTSSALVQSATNTWATCEVVATSRTFTGTPIGTTTLPQGRHEEDCCLACQNDPACDGWTSETTGTCTMFASVSNTSPTTPTTGWSITGVVN